MRLPLGFFILATFWQPSNALLSCYEGKQKRKETLRSGCRFILYIKRERGRQRLWYIPTDSSYAVTATKRTLTRKAS